LHPDLKFTTEFSDNILPFLDVLVKIEKYNISTDIYAKPTDSHNYLDFFSSHAKHTKLNIPFNLASRLITIVSDNDILENRLQELFIFLKSRNYPDEIIYHGIQKARDKGPLTFKLENVDSNGKNDVISFVSTYNPGNFNIFPIIQNYEHLMKTDKRMETILKKKRLSTVKDNLKI
jgi:hypothetical protein